MATAAAPSPAVSVIVPHYGPADPVLALAATLAGQRRGPDGIELELIVVDDASPQALDPDRIHAATGSLPTTVLRRERNGGFGAAVNTGAAQARHELLLVLNSDVTVADGAIAELVAAAAPWQPCVAGPRLVDDNNEPVWSARHFPATRHHVAAWLTPLARWRHTRAWHRAVGHDVAAARAATRATSEAAGRGSGTGRETGPAGGLGAPVVPVDWLVGAALLLPAAAFRAVGGFDERFHMNTEEVDLQRRLRAHGVPAVLVAGVCARHTGGASSDPARRREWLVESWLTDAWLRGGPAARRRLQAALAAATSVNLAVNTARRAAGRDLDPVAIARTEWRLLRGRR